MTNTLDKIKQNLYSVLKSIDKRYEEEVYEHEDSNEPYTLSDVEEYVDDNPYEDASWGPAENWHCIRCGAPLREMDEKDPYHGKECFSDMRKDGTLYYQCSNDKCFHYTAPLLLHHPVYGYKHPAGDSYSISWVK